MVIRTVVISAKKHLHASGDRILSAVIIVVLTRIAVALLPLLLCCCDRLPETYPPPRQRQPPVSTPDPSTIMVDMNDPDASQHIVKDIYEPFGSTWRWTAQQPTVKVLVYATDNVKLTADFTIWSEGLQQTGPIELSFLVNGHLLDKLKYATAGYQHFEKASSCRLVVRRHRIDHLRRCRQALCLASGRQEVRFHSDARRVPPVMHAALTVLAILFGWLFTVVTAWALGTLLLRKLSLVFYRSEERLFAFIVGSALLSAIVFVLCAVQLGWKSLFLVLGLAIILYALRSGAHHPRGDSFPPLPRVPRWIFLVVFSAFTVIYFINALEPESSPDGMAYHLGVVAKYQRSHGFPRITTDMYASLSEGIELLFLWAFEYGRHSAAALVHFAFFLALVFLILSYARRIGRPAVGLAAALFSYLSPVVGLDGTIAYIDVAITAILFALFYLLQIWDQDRNPQLLLPHRHPSRLQLRREVHRVCCRPVYARLRSLEIMAGP